MFKPIESSNVKYARKEQAGYWGRSSGRATHHKTNRLFTAESYPRGRSKGDGDGSGGGNGSGRGKIKLATSSSPVLPERRYTQEGRVEEMDGSY